MLTTEVDFIIGYSKSSRFRVLKREVGRSNSQKTAEESEGGESHGVNVREFREEETMDS